MKEILMNIEMLFDRILEVFNIAILFFAVIAIFLIVLLIRMEIKNGKIE